MLDYEIPAAEAAELLKEKKAKLIDVREPWEVAQVHVEGCELIPMNEIPARREELDTNERLLVMCHHGVRSMHVTAWLRNQGYEQVQSVRGGIDAWALEVDRQIGRY